ncbi:MAG: hypothetical protein OXG82_14905 [Gammaproteobacteria bacterium]|nr:hypothetical protein [Gammaproteobacteria bacterium]
MSQKPTYQVDLTREQIAFFRDNGFLRIERITADEEVAWLKGIYDQLFIERAGEGRVSTTT